MEYLSFRLWVLLGFLPVGIASPSFDLVFSLTTGIMKKLLSITRNKKKKHDKRKFNSIENLVSQALIEIEISHEEFVAIFKEKYKYEKLKENVSNISKRLEEKTKNMRLNSVNSRNITSL